MWVLFGALTILATMTNIVLYIKGKNYELAMAIALSLTALTLCAEYQLIANWVVHEDWAALLDVVPTMEKMLWLFVIGSIVVNILPTILTWRKR